jgi:hypothetical protein
MRRHQLAALIPFLLVPRLASPQGDPLGPEFRVNTFTPNDQAYSSIVSGGSGFVVVWESLIGGTEGFAVSGQRYDSDGVPLGTEFRVNTYVTSAQRSPAVGINAAGNFVVVWESAGQDGSGWGVFGQRFAPSGAPVGPEFRVNASVVGDQLRPDVAVDPSGGFLVAWQSGPLPGPGVTFDVFAQRYNSSGAPAGPEFRVNTYTSFNPLSPAVATDPAGNFVVVWTSQFQEGTGYVVRFGVYAQRYASSGVPLGPEFRVNTYTTDYQGRPAVAFDAAGNFVVVWSDWVQDGSYMGVFGQRYSSLGIPSGPEFRVNTETFDSQRAPAVASDASGNVMVTWHGDDGSFWGVFGQRYGGIFPVELTDFRVD